MGSPGLDDGGDNNDLVQANYHPGAEDLGPLGVGSIGGSALQ